MYIVSRFFLLNLFLLLFVVFSNSQVVNIEGYIHAAGKPVNGATIKIPTHQIAVVTDSNGFFKLQLVNAGIYNIAVTAVEHNKKIIKIEVKEAENVPLDIELTQTQSYLNEVVFRER